MAFRFNFRNSDNCIDLNTENTPQSVSDEESKFKTDCNYISIANLNLKVEKDKVKTARCGKYEIKYITQELVINDSPDFQLLDKLKTDLLPGRYEGGFKVWECSFDLIHYLVKENHICPDTSVLELGCGVGLPGLLCYLCGAFVTFQDYNSEVLELITAPNVILNTIDNERVNVSKLCEFLSGDWCSIKEKLYSNHLEKKLFDVIITSETIYNKSSQTKLLALMKSALKPNGVIYLASKVHYFGVGGGIAEFEELLKKDDTFEFSTVYKTAGGVERQILRLAFKKKKEV